MYGRRRVHDPQGKVSQRQRTLITSAMLDAMNLGIEILGITGKSQDSEVEQLIRFVQTAIHDAAVEEIRNVRDKGRLSHSQELDLKRFIESANHSISFCGDIIRRKVDFLHNGANPENFSLDAWKQKVGHLWEPFAPRPKLLSPDATPRQAEIHCCQIMLFLGEAGSQTTQYSQDGGVDVHSEFHVCQVKHLKSPVGVQTIREISGVANLEQKIGIVFAKSGFTNEAIAFATSAGVLLISYGLGLQSWTVASNVALTKGLGNARLSIKSSNPIEDTRTAQLWKKSSFAIDRDEI